MILVVPIASAVTSPVADPMDAVSGALLLHTPPAGVVVSAAPAPRQTAEGPPMPVGPGFIDITALLAIARVQPKALVATTV